MRRPQARQVVERKPDPAPEVKQTAASGVADFRAQFMQAKQIEEGKRKALEAFERFKAEQQQAELAKQKTALEPARQKEAAAIERGSPKRGRDGPGFSR